MSQWLSDWWRGWLEEMLRIQKPNYLFKLRKCFTCYSWRVLFEFLRPLFWLIKPKYLLVCRLCVFQIQEKKILNVMCKLLIFRINNLKGKLYFLQCTLLKFFEKENSLFCSSFIHYMAKCKWIVHCFYLLYFIYESLGSSSSSTYFVGKLSVSNCKE